MAGLKAFGASEQELERIRGEFKRIKGSGNFEVWPENWRAFELFEACSTQWDVLAAGLEGTRFWEGINYTRLADVAERLLPPAEDTYVPPKRELFQQIRILERAAMRALNARG